jgi:hypothetical protein
MLCLNSGPAKDPAEVRRTKKRLARTLLQRDPLPAGRFAVCVVDYYASKNYGQQDLCSGSDFVGENVVYSIPILCSATFASVLVNDYTRPT